ncbi:MAG TPA: allophanate hydrolase subunit 1 [Pseudonocardia sp.]|jgi:KipI family sensor histidine kinase inhibitor
MLRYGGSGLLVELGSTAEVAAAYRALSAARDAGRLGDVRELVPAARTVYVSVAAGPAPAAEVRAVLEEPAPSGADATAEAAELVLPVRYDGADLDLVARTAELSVAEVVELHSSAAYTVAFCGFAPGFGYLVGVPGPLRQARLDDSRSQVPPGSVGLAGEFTGVYPRSSPGGWRLIGRTEEVLFDPAAEHPARLTPGVRVRFEPVR